MGLHERYKEILPADTLTLDKETEEKMEALTEKFKGMMKTLHKQKGAEMELSIMKSAAVQDFIKGHAEVLDSAFSEREMSEAMCESLKASDYIFSGMKTFHELKESFPKLVDKDGVRKPFERFYNDVRRIDKTYNRNYLRAEYKFAQQSANMAAKWEEFERDGDRYLLQYRTMNDDRVRDSHKSLHGITLPVSDSFWDDFTPPNSWGCRCTVVQVRRGKYKETDHDTAMGRGAAATENDKRGMFRFNPGKERKTFPDYNTYTISKCKTCPLKNQKGKLAKVPISDNEVCEVCKDYITLEDRERRNLKKYLQNQNRRKNVKEFIAELNNSSAKEILPRIDEYSKSFDDSLVYEHKLHGDVERDNNLRMARFFSDKLKTPLYMLPRLDPCGDDANLRPLYMPIGCYDKKSPDYVLGRFIVEAKSMVESRATTAKEIKVAIENRIKKAKTQAKHIALEIEEDIPQYHIDNAIMNSLYRNGMNKKKRTVLVKHGRKLLIYR